MYSIVKIGAHQYRVQPGDLLDVQKLTQKENEALQFDEVLFVGGEHPVVGQPTVKGARVLAQVLKHDKAKKIVVFKRKPGLYHKRMGHRQPYTALLITEINDGQGNSVTIDKESKNAKKYLGGK